MQARLSSLRRRYEEYRRLGVKLKHDRDDLIRRASRMATNDVSTPGSHSTSNSGGQIATAGNTSSSGGSSSGSRPSLTTQELKQSVAIGLESIMAFVLAFRLMAEARSIESKVQDVNSWESLIPHLGILRNETKVGSSSSSSDNQLSRREMAMQIPHALASYLHAIVVDEAIQAVTTLADTGASGSGAATNGTGSNSGEYSGPAAVARLVRYTKQRSSTWRLARTAAERLVPPPPPAGTVGDHSHGNNGNGNGVSQQLTGPQLALRERTRARLERIGPWMHADEAVALTHKVLRAWAAEEGVEGWEAELAL